MFLAPVLACAAAASVRCSVSRTALNLDVPRLFEQGQNLNDTDVLLEVGASVGLDRDGLRSVLEEGGYTDKVLADERLASELGVQAVPKMLVGRAGESLEAAQAVSGAQPYEYVRAAVERALHGDSLSGPKGPVFRPQLPTL